MIMRSRALPLFLVLIAATAVHAAAPPPAANPHIDAPSDAQKPGWTLTFDDEFNGSTLDTQRWNTNYRGNTSLPANYVMVDGVLHLRIDRDAPPPRGDGGGRVSGIETRRSGKPFSQEYGWFEVRARCHKGAGIACAFWLSPLDGEYDKLKIDGGTRDSANEATEIDIFEQQGNDPNGNNFTVHYGRSYGTEHGSDARHTIFPFSLTSEFHTYALEWNADWIIWYVDGKEVHRSNKAPHTPFFIRLSMYEHNSPWCGDIDPKDPYPKDFEVDYVRVYSKAGSTKDKQSADTANDWSKPGWHLTFHDEFDGKTVDPRHFVPRFDDNPKEQADVSVHDGVCHLLMEKDSPTTRPDAPGRVSALETRHADNEFAQEYGWFEVRARVAAGSGLGSGFWLLPLDQDYLKLASDGGTRASADEPTAIDVFEFFGKDTHANNFDVHYGAGKNDQATEAMHSIVPIKLSDEFHVYALNWTPTQLIWYVDGKEVHRSNKSPQTPFFIRLALFEGDIIWRGPVDRSHYPADFEIDYVRVYSKTDPTPR